MEDDKEKTTTNDYAQQPEMITKETKPVTEADLKDAFAKDGLDETKTAGEQENSEGEKKKPWAIVVSIIASLLIGSGATFAVWKLTDSETCTTDDGEVVYMSCSEGVKTENGCKCAKKSCDCIEKEVISELNENDLALKFLRLHNDKSNMVYSPLSIRYALNMLADGASGETKAQLDTLLGQITPNKYNNVDGAIGFANGIWVRDGFGGEIKDEYKNRLSAGYNAVIKYDAFSSAENINNWIKNETLGMLEDVIESISEEEFFFLINALAINVDWQNKFDDDLTRGAFFYVNGYEDSGNYINATMMNKGNMGDIKYNFAKDAIAVSMDLKQYGDTALQFVAIMPTADLDAYTNSLEIEDIDRLLNGMVEPGVDNRDVSYHFSLQIPKFNIKDGGLPSFDEDLKSLGVVDAFDKSRADFTSMDNTNGEDGRIFVTQAIHDATFDFNEKGIKAAAVTVIGGGRGSAGIDLSSENVLVNINKPFLFMVREKNKGDVWFMGRVYQPNKWDDDKDKYVYQD